MCVVALWWCGWNVQHKSWGFDFRRNSDLLPASYGQYSTELFTSEAETIIAQHDCSKVDGLLLCCKCVMYSDVGIQYTFTDCFVITIYVAHSWCLQKLLGIKWYHHVRNDEVRRTTGQPRLSAIVQARRLSLFGHIARMSEETDARSTITASPSEDWRKPPGRPRTTWMKTIQQDLRSNNLSLDEAITVAQNRPLWRLMSVFGAMHP